MKRYAVYFFDFDGTLVDSLDSLVEIYNAGFRYLGYEISKEQASQYMHISLQETADVANVPESKRLKWAQLIVDALHGEAAVKATHDFPEVREVLSKLKTLGCDISVVTGNTVEHSRAVLENLGLLSYFDGFYSGNDYKPKPEPDALLAGIASYKGLSKKDCVYIGDSLQDVECASRAGIDGILIDRNDEHPDFKGTRIKDLRDIFL